MKNSKIKNAHILFLAVCMLSGLACGCSILGDGNDRKYIRANIDRHTVDAEKHTVDAEKHAVDADGHTVNAGKHTVDTNRHTVDIDKNTVEVVDE